MPKRRDGKAPSVVFSVSPWQEKEQPREEYDNVAPGGELYSVVTVPLVVGAATGAGGKWSGGLAAAGQHRQGPTDAPSSTPVDAAPPAAAAKAAVPQAGAWQAKKRKPAEEEAAPVAAPPHAPDLQPARGAAAGEPDAAAAAEAQPVVLEGTAYLALLPSNNVTGVAGEGRSVPVSSKASNDGHWYALQWLPLPCCSQFDHASG